MGGGGGGRLFEAGRLLSFSAFRMGAYSRWALIRGWALIRINTVTRGNFPGGTPHMKGVGMIVGNFELDPYRRPISAWPKLFLTPKRDRVFILHSCKTMDKDVVFKYCCYKKLDFMNGVNKTKKKIYISNVSAWSYENRVSKHFVIFLNFPYLIACLLCCLLMSFFFCLFCG